MLDLKKKTYEPNRSNITYRTYHANTKEYTKTDHIVGHIASLNKLKKKKWNNPLHPIRAPQLIKAGF